MALFALPVAHAPAPPSPPLLDLAVGLGLELDCPAVPLTSSLRPPKSLWHETPWWPLRLSYPPCTLLRPKRAVPTLPSRWPCYAATAVPPSQRGTVGSVSAQLAAQHPRRTAKCMTASAAAAELPLPSRPCCPAHQRGRSKRDRDRAIWMDQDSPLPPLCLRRAFAGTFWACHAAHAHRPPRRPLRQGHAVEVGFYVED
eukprot:361857-Chlamydomonas_euryale.AAC.1